MPNSMRLCLFVVATAAALSIMLAMSRMECDLKPWPLNGKAVVAFELVGTPEGADELLNGWTEQQRIAVGFSLGLDFLLMLSYGTSMTLGCLWAYRFWSDRKWRMKWLGMLIVAAQPIAALFDVMENVALLRQLLSSAESPWPEIARYCALMKFGALTLGALFMVVTAMGWLSRRWKPDD
jgi:hypothetical protein